VNGINEGIVVKGVKGGYFVVGIDSHHNGTSDWDRAAGVICRSCSREVFRNRDGLCMDCWEKANEFEIRDKAGVLHFVPANVIMAIARPAKKEG